MTKRSWLIGLALTLPVVCLGAAGLYVLAVPALGTASDDPCRGRVVEAEPPPPVRMSAPLPGGGARSLGLGGNRSCAAFRDGSVRCWGSDRQFPPDSAGPSLADLLNREPRATTLVTSSRYGCALAAARVRCWQISGERSHGETLRLAETTSPRDAGYDAVFIGASSACARRRNGEMWCWGAGEPWLDPGQALAPTRLARLDGASSISITNNQLCWLKQGQVFCAPRRKLELLRSSAQDSDFAPKLEASALAGCGRSSVALDRLGRTVAWSDDEGEPLPLTNLNSTSTLERNGDALCTVGEDRLARCWSCAELPRGRTLPLLTRAAVRRAFSRDGECAVEEAGTVRCSGTIPPSGNGLRLREAKPHTLAGIGDALDVALDEREVCTRGRDRPWSCQLLSDEGKSLRLSATDWEQSRAPELVPEGAGAEEVAVNRFALCFRSAEGLTACRRRAPDGSLGEPLSLGKTQRWAIGDHHACITNTSDELWCWGANETGQVLGLSQPSNVETPRKVLDGAVDVAVGLRHTCALLREGRIVCFGDGSDGKFASATRDSAGRVTLAEFSEKPKRLVAGQQHTCALGEAGHVFCWGSASAPGNGERPRPISGLNDVTSIAAGGHQTCTLLASGRVVCWSALDGSQTSVASTEGAVELAVGNSHACILQKSGEVRCWGSNNLGVLGRDLPVRRDTVRPPNGCEQVSYRIDGEDAAAAPVAW